MDADLFTKDTLIQALQELKLKERDNEEKYNEKPPLKLEAPTWVSWERGMRNYLSQLPSHVAGVSLIYVVRKLIPPGYTLIGDDKRRIHSLSLTGPLFQRDNKKVYIRLKQLLVHGQAWSRILEMDQTKNGHDAWIRLVQHYDGPGDQEKRIAMANDQICSLYYKDERAFAFKTFVSKLKSAYKILTDNGIPKVDREKVSKMCEKINSPHLTIQHAVNISRTGMNP